MQLKISPCSKHALWESLQLCVHGCSTANTASWRWPPECNSAMCVCTVYYTCGWFVALRMRAHRSARSPVGQPCLLYCCAAALSSSITTTQETWRQNREWVHSTAVIHLRTRLPSPGNSPRNIQKEGLKKSSQNVKLLSVIHEVKKNITKICFWTLMIKHLIIKKSVFLSG